MAAANFSDDDLDSTVEDGDAQPNATPKSLGSSHRGSNRCTSQLRDLVLQKALAPSEFSLYMDVNVRRWLLCSISSLIGPKWSIFLHFLNLRPASRSYFRRALHFFERNWNIRVHVTLAVSRQLVRSRARTATSRFHRWAHLRTTAMSLHMAFIAILVMDGTWYVAFFCLFLLPRRVW